MVSEKMTVHRALAELKVIDDRIEKQINSVNYVYANKHSNPKIGGNSIAEVKNQIKRDYDKVTSLINRKLALKKAIELSNSITKVNINGNEYTVVEAISLKNNGIETKVDLLNKLRNNYQLVQNTIDKNNSDVNEKSENYVIAMYGGKDTKTDPEIIRKAKEDFINSNSYDIVDAISIKKVIDDLTDEIDSFKSEVDAVLSESNAITEVTFTY